MRQHRWLELLSDYDCEIRYHPGKANMILKAQAEAMKEENIKEENLRVNERNRLDGEANEIVLEGGSLEAWSVERGDSVASIKRRRRDFQSDGVEDSVTTSEDANPICTLEDYSRPSHEGYKNTIELLKGNNVSEDPNQHLKDFLKLMHSLDLDVENRERTRLHLFQFSFRDQASNWLERLPADSISTWDDLTTHFLAQFFSPRRTAKLHNDIMMFQQHQGESLSEAWTHFKDLL
ncbi:zinc finger, CCHC-type containing protein [Tanacetum coccineum]